MGKQETNHKSAFRLSANSPKWSRKLSNCSLVTLIPLSTSHAYTIYAAINLLKEQCFIIRAIRTNLCNRVSSWLSVVTIMLFDLDWLLHGLKFSDLLVSTIR